MSVPMPKEAISDEKRLVRGLQYTYARGFLRARDYVHHDAWRFLTLAGPDPSEEINCIRELVPRAHITSVDTEIANVEAAIVAGADEVFCGDISEFEIDDATFNKIKKPAAFLKDQTFDVMCLDFTSSATPWMRSVVSVYWTALAPKGVMIVTFSYGRDVREAQMYEWEAAKAKKTHYADGRVALADAGVATLLRVEDLPEAIASRVYVVFKTRSRYLRSMLQYTGNKMPMMSCLLHRKDDDFIPKFKKISEYDYELAVTAENLGAVFACPADRIDELRRRLTAAKAVKTRQTRQLSAAKPVLSLPPPPKPAIEAAPSNGSRRPWSNEELAFLKSWAGRKPVREIAGRVNRSEGAVRQMAHAMGLSVRRPFFLERSFDGEHEDRVGDTHLQPVDGMPESKSGM